jgi:hypothetical protein
VDPSPELSAPILVAHREDFLRRHRDISVEVEVKSQSAPSRLSVADVDVIGDKRSASEAELPETVPASPEPDDGIRQSSRTTAGPAKGKRSPKPKRRLQGLLKECFPDLKKARLYRREYQRWVAVFGARSPPAAPANYKERLW